MGTILQFAERLAEHGDWTPAERSQLRDMGAQLGQSTAGLDLVFGKTEEGDPWCVVADDRSEVLLHVARIAGNFVVHAPRNDQVIESHDLWLAVSRVLGGVLRDRRGVVLPFAPQMMGQPTVLALMVAAAVRGDFTEIVQNALPVLPAGDERAATSPALPPAAQEPAAAVAQQGAPAEPARAPQTAFAVPAHGGAAAATAVAVAAGQAEAGPLDSQAPVRPQALAETAPILRTAPDPGHVPANAAPAQGTSLAPQTPPAVAEGDGAGRPGAGFGVATTEGGAGLAATGGPGAAAVGGSGTAGGGGEAAAGVPTAPAEAGNAVVVRSGAVAQGQMGASDVFILTAPVRTEGSNVISLGVVSGFSVGEGDQLVFANGAAPTIVQVVELNPLAAGASGLAGETARRIGYDFNGDGREDAYVLVVDAPQPVELHKAAGVEVSLDQPVALQGVPPAAAASITVVFIGQ